MTSRRDYMDNNNISLRTVNADDISKARTDYQRNASWIISVNGVEYYSDNVSTRSLRLCVAMHHQRQVIA